MSFSNKLVFDEFDDALRPLGFTQPRRGLFVIGLTPDTVGWIGVNTAIDREDNSLTINPVVGVRNNQIESKVAELSMERLDPVIPPTLSTNIGTIKPTRKYEDYTVYNEFSLSQIVAEIVEEINRFGMPFMRSNTDLVQLTANLQSGRFSFEHQSMLRIPVALRVLGRSVEANAFVEKALGSMRVRSDPAADYFRRFADAFYRR